MRNSPLGRLGHWCLALLLALAMTTAVNAAQTVEIHTPEDLLSMAENPAGDYILMADLDMGGMDWTGPDFSGTFDGNGHAILNLTLAGPGSSTETTCDGNLKTYESQFVGFFSTLKNASVKNLTLLNVRAVVETDSSCFLGGLAGYAKNSTIENCTVTGSLELRAFNRMFGIGGIVGYGSGRIDQCTADVTLISTDTDKSLDEMFLGGLCGMGFFDMTNSRVTLDAYASEYGYVHSGGLMGMMIRYPLGDWTSAVTGNQVSGKITFFECNSDRRAYCEAFIGEQMTKYCNMANNTQDFLRDERREFTELRPETCEAPAYSQTPVAANCSNYGYTRYTCDGCGYSYADHFTLYGEHEVTQWEVQDPPTLEQEGVSTGRCIHCAGEFQRTEPKLEPQPTEPPTEATEAPEPPTESPAANTSETPKDARKPALLLLGGCLAAALLLLLIGGISRPGRRGRYQKFR